MDWANDNACLCRRASDLRRVFKYQPRPSRVIKIVEENDYQAQVWSLESPKDWAAWLDKHVDSTDRGLVLLLADRSENYLPHKATYGPMSIDEWLAKSTDLPARPLEIRRAETFARLGEKPTEGHSSCDQTPEYGRQPRGLRHLPYSLETFESICEKFQVHDSIVRVVTRTDVPTISSARVDMNGPALVYSCRTPNTWDSDMALSVTHYPEKDLTFGILYGTTFGTEKIVLQKLQTIRLEATHPLLLTGILAELELSRHTRLVEDSGNEVETRIFELNFQSGHSQGFQKLEVERRNIAKRTAWLDLTYLRNSITTWSTQILKLIEQAERMKEELYGPDHSTLPSAYDVFRSRPRYSVLERQISQNLTPPDADSDTLSVDDSLSQHGSESCANTAMTRPSTRPQVLRGVSSHECHAEMVSENPSSVIRRKTMHKFCEKIRARLSDIRDEYDEKIRDCTMRVDGMAMATQWSHSETAVEIALATNQDSKVMRSISLVTMVFLPGTFFATVFSMTFFDWFDDSGKTRVSSYLWIYVVVTVFFTGITIGLWYFFVMSRRTGRFKGDEEKVRVE
ncbi:hypothetical protein FB567DRAFT_278455 [Paraphoma chrysanthemicola]|uniref:Uncharacterized protein n=1 Tax=Paraphoma chrysanthemicola TaxID=798071 RepID=A0A8K0RF02_9PLEO|nr:hypothetical protein FB567DRAFT_278455 [Paraphoma chrysanthemicola]